MARGGTRPGAGRPRKSTAEKALTGTLRKDRELVASEDVPLGPMIVPMHLSDLAQLHFRTIADMLVAQNRSSPHYAEHVALLAQRLEQIQRWQAVLEMSGDTYETNTTAGGTLFRARPEVKFLSDAMRHAQSLLGELMLNPAAALRIATVGDKKEAGDFDDF